MFVSINVVSAESSEFLHQCLEPSKVTQEICADNKGFLQPATECFALYRKFTDQEMKALELENQSGTQMVQFSDASKNFTKSQTTIQKILLWNEATDSLLKKYLASFVQPIDNRNPHSRFCFGDPYQRISKIRQDLLDDRKKFQKLSRSLGQKMNRTEFGKERLEPSAIKEIPKSNLGSPNSFPKSGKKYRPSDISGTKETQDKQ